MHPENPPKGGTTNFAVKGDMIMLVFQTNKKTMVRTSETACTQVFSITNPLSFIELFFSKDETEENGEKSGSKRYIWYIIGLFALILANAVFFMWRETPESSDEKLKRLMANEDYRNAVILCNNLLSEHPKDASSIYTIATEAMLKDILADGWNDKIITGLFTDARVILTNAANQSGYNPEGLKAVEVFNWITDLEEYFFKSDSETPVIIFRDEIHISYLLTQWDKNKKDIRKVLNQIFSQSYPVAEENGDNNTELTQHKVYTHLNILQNQKNLYFGVIQDLKKSIQKEIDAENPVSAISAIAEFKRRFPGIGGLNLLEADASNYIELYQAVKSKKWSQIPKLSDKIRFQTELFAESVDRLLMTHEKLSRTREIFKQKRKDSVLLSKSSERR